MFPPRESSSRDLGQLTTRPPSIHRDPNTRSAWSRAATSWGSCSGACDPSASISTRTPNPRSRPQVKPSMYSRSLYVGTMTSTPASVGCGGTGNPYSLLVRYLVYIGTASGPPGDERSATRAGQYRDRRGDQRQTDSTYS